MSARILCARRGRDGEPVLHERGVATRIDHALRDVAFELLVGAVGGPALTVTRAVHERDSGGNAAREAVRQQLHHRVVLRQMRAVPEQDEG